MTFTTLSGSEFKQDIDHAKRAADDGPVIIIELGEPAYVLLRHDDYLRLASGRPTIRELLDSPGVDDIDFEPPRFGGGIFRPANLS